MKMMQMKCSTKVVCIIAVHRDMPCQIGSDYQPIIRKEDGSLYNGTEFVTQPMTLRAHRQIDYGMIRGLVLKAIILVPLDCTHTLAPKSYFSHRQLLIFLMLHRDLALDVNLLDFISKGESRWAKRQWQYHVPTQKPIKGGRITQLALA